MFLNAHFGIYIYYCNSSFIDFSFRLSYQARSAVVFNILSKFVSQRKKDKYQELFQALNSQFSSVKFVNLSVSCLGIFGRSADSFIDMCKELEIDKSYLRFIIRKPPT